MYYTVNKEMADLKAKVALLQSDVDTLRSHLLELTQLVSGNPYEQSALHRHDVTEVANICFESLKYRLENA
jgi:hypothetical protein